MINEIHHVAMSVADMDRSLAFYRDLLGFEVALDRSWEDAGETGDKILAVKGTAARQTMLQAGNAMVELFQFTRPQPTPMARDRPVIDRGITHLCFHVTDVYAEYRRLSQAGVICHCEPQDLGAGCRTTYARDPDGNVVEFQELFSPPRTTLGPTSTA